jgi:hypothetical protein
MAATAFWGKQIEHREIAPEISAIDGRQAIALAKREGADQKIGNRIAAWAARNREDPLA